MKLKIGFVLDDSIDKTDGVQQYILTLGHWYSALGHEVHYLVGQTQRTDIQNVHSLSRNVQVHFNQNRMSTPLPANKKAIKKLLSQQQFDVLHVQLPYSPFMAGRIVKYAPKATAVVGTFHIIPFSALESAATRLLGLALHKNLKRFDAIYSVSAPAQKFAQKTFGVKSQVLPNAVNVSHFKSGKKIAKYNDDKLNIVFLGRLVERKGCMYLLKALQLLHQQNKLPRVRVLIGGKGPLNEHLHEYVRLNHLGNVVNFTGFVDESKKADFFATADIAVLPSTGGESFGIVLVEAMAAGAKVVIGGNNVGYASVMPKRPGHLVDPTNTTEFAKLIYHYISSQRARNAEYKWQQEHVKQYEVRTVGDKLISESERPMSMKA